jgi:hypothetical protein
LARLEREVGLSCGRGAGDEGQQAGGRQGSHGEPQATGMWATASGGQKNA